MCFCLQALNFLIQLGQEQSDPIYTVISSLDTVRALVGLAVSCQSGPARLLALRALSSVCCTGTTVAQLEECGGVDIVCGLLESGRWDWWLKVGRWVAKQGDGLLSREMSG